MVDGLDQCTSCQSLPIQDNAIQKILGFMEEDFKLNWRYKVSNSQYAEQLIINLKGINYEFQNHEIFLELMPELLTTHIRSNVFDTTYLYAIRNFHLKSKLVRSYNARFLNQGDDWKYECDILQCISKNFMSAYENYERALDLIWQTKQFLGQHSFQESKDYLHCINCECFCLWYLWRQDEIEIVLEKFCRSTPITELPIEMQLATILNYDFDWRPKIWCVLPFFFICRYAKTIRYCEKCLLLIQKNPKLDGVDNVEIVQFGFKGHVRLAWLNVLYYLSVKTLRIHPTQ